MYIEMTLKNQLHLYLEHKHYTITQLSKIAKVPKQTIHNWSVGQKPGDIRQVKKVAEALSTTIDNLMFGEGIEIIDKKIENRMTSLMEGEYISGIFEIKIRKVKS